LQNPRQEEKTWGFTFRAARFMDDDFKYERTSLYTSMSRGTFWLPRIHGCAAIPKQKCHKVHYLLSALVTQTNIYSVATLTTKRHSKRRFTRLLTSQKSGIASDKSRSATNKQQSTKEYCSLEGK
jgi:hypothetical protein